MPGEVTKADENSSPDDSYVAPSIDSMLGKAQGKTPEPTELEDAPEPKVEPKAEIVAEDVAPVETPTPDPQVELEIESPAGKPPKGFAPVQALQAEREKTREAREQLQAALLQNQQFQSQAPQPQYLEAQPPDVDIDPNAVIRNQVATISEKIARQTYSDYDEKFGALRDAMIKDPGTYAPLYNSIMQSENPGEASYRAGIHILETKKYGADVVSDPVKYRAAIRKELEAELKPKIESDTHKAIQGKLTERSKTPTDISDARAAGGSSEPEYQPKSFEALHRSVYKPKR